MTLLDHWFLGNSDEIIQVFKDVFTEPDRSQFTKTFIEENMSILVTFFQRSLDKYRKMRKIDPGRESHLIHQHELDDLMTKLSCS